MSEMAIETPINQWENKVWESINSVLNEGKFINKQ
jgi:hypothetical protein